MGLESEMEQRVLESVEPFKEVDEFTPLYDHEKSVSESSQIAEIPISQPIMIQDTSPTIIAVDSDGKYVGKFIGSDIPPGTFPVSVDTDSAYRVWNFEKQEWGDLVIAPPFVLKKSFVTVLRDEGFISQTETIGFLARGEFPVVFKKSFDFMTQDERNSVEVDLVTEAEISSDSLFIQCFMKSQKLSKDQLDRLLVKCLPQ